MKRILNPLRLLAALAALSAPLFAQNVANSAVTKKTQGNLINEDLVIGSGRTLDVSAGTINLADNQIPVAKVNGALSASTAASTYQPLDADLTSIAALTTTSFGRSVLTQADAAALRTLLSLVPGTNVQAWSANLDTFSGYTPASLPVSTAQQALFDAQQLILDSLQNGEGSNWIVVDTSAGDPLNNGANLLSAYAVAKTLTPNGLAKSDTNRSLVLVPPGKYTITVTLLLDTEFVDIVGTTGNAKDVLITSAVANDNEGTITQTASNVRIVGVTLENTQNTNARNNNATDPAAYAPSSSLANARLEKVILLASNQAWATRLSTTYSGTYIDVTTTGSRAFGYAGVASGNFIRVSCGGSAFGASGTASGNFTNCAGGTGSFGATASGSFTDCLSLDGSFGSSGTASGTFVRCVGGANSFGGDGACSGSFDFCVGGSLSFGGTDFDPGTLTGTLRFCRLTTGNFQTVSGAGKTRYCLTGSNVTDNQN